MDSLSHVRELADVRTILGEIGFTRITFATLPVGFDMPRG
jgi:hypothetical protein